MAKKGRDPNAPKRNLSAYLLYQNAMRDQFKAQNPGMTFGQLSKYTSAMYGEMPPSEKELWIARAGVDKDRYLQQLAAYAPPQGYDAKGDRIESMVEYHVNNSGKPKKSKPQKDPNAPKRNLSAYLLYQNAMREQFRSDNPKMTFGQIARYSAHMYKGLTQEEKNLWLDRADQDKIRYETALTTYVPPPGFDERGVMVEDRTPKKKKKSARKDPLAPKRASGAYVFFTNEARPLVWEEFPGLKFIELGRKLGERWRALLPEEKSRFEVMANQDKLRYQMEMQEYQQKQVADQKAKIDERVNQERVMQEQEEKQMAFHAQAAAEAQITSQVSSMGQLPGAAQHYYHNLPVYQAQDQDAVAMSQQHYNAHIPLEHQHMVDQHDPNNAVVEQLGLQHHHVVDQHDNQEAYLDPNQAYYPTSQDFEQKPYAGYNA